VTKAFLPALASLLSCSAAVLSPSAHAAWVEYDRDENMTQYYESVIKKKGSIATVTVLSNAKLPVEVKEGQSFRSVVITAEFDCDKQIGRDLAYTFKSGAMGAGANVPVGEVADKKWDTAKLSAESDASRYAIWKIACGKK
jgi:hypothetical protein